MSEMTDSESDIVFDRALHIVETMSHVEEVMHCGVDFPVFK